MGDLQSDNSWYHVSCTIQILFKSIIHFIYICLLINGVGKLWQKAIIRSLKVAKAMAMYVFHSLQTVK